MYTLWYHHQFAASDEIATFDDFPGLVAAALKLAKGKELIPMSHSFVAAAKRLGNPVLAWQIKGGPTTDIIIATKEE